MKKRQELILDAAENDFSLPGYKESSVMEIAGAAGVSSAIINKYMGKRLFPIISVLDEGIRKGEFKRWIWNLPAWPYQALTPQNST